MGVGVYVSVPPCLGIGLDRISQYRIVAFHAVFAAEGSSHLLRHFRPGLGVSILNYFTQHDPSHSVACATHELYVLFVIIMHSHLVPCYAIA